MARPWKHPKTGVYWLRKGIPEGLRPLMGKREEKRSLHTRDPEEVRQRHARALAELEAQWANLRSGPRQLTQKEAHALASTYYDGILTHFADNPAQQQFWRTDLGDTLFATPDPAADISSPEWLTRVEPDFVPKEAMRAWCRSEADALLQKNGLRVDEASRHTLVLALAHVAQQACRTLERYARGDYGPDPDAPRYPVWTGGGDRRPTKPKAEGVSFDMLIEGWASEKRPSEKTLYSWRRVFDQLARFIGHRDAAQVSAEDLIRWKAELIGAGLHPKTVRDDKIAPIKAILQWGVDNRRLAVNPAERVLVDVKVRAADTIRSFTDEEARTILKAALQERDPVRRWVCRGSAPTRAHAYPRSVSCGSRTWCTWRGSGA